MKNIFLNLIMIAELLVIAVSVMFIAVVLILVNSIAGGLGEFAEVFLKTLG